LSIDEIRIEPLTKRHRRTDFGCGVVELDLYLRNIARQDLRKSAATVFVATPDGERVAGFYTLSQSSIELDLLDPSLRAELPKYPSVPATLLGRLAVDKQFQGMGLGKLLLLDAFARVCSVASVIATAMIVVDAKDDSAVRFYRSYGFQELTGMANRLVLPLETARKAVLGGR